MKKLYKAKSAIARNGLFIGEPAKKGETIAYVHGDMVTIRHFTTSLSKKTMNWIGAGRYTWIDTDQSPFRYINHSCQPNAAIITRRKVIALKDIAKDSELTIDYSLNEADTGWSIGPCNCQTKNCRGQIYSVQSLPRKIFNSYKKCMAKNFIKIYEVENT